MILYALSLIFSIAFLLYSANIFVDGASGTAKYFKMPPLLIGMVIVGFGTSAPELMVSAISSLSKNSGIALGNAYGSNIANIALILGLTAIIKPIYLNSSILKKELPILTGITLLSLYQIYDREVSRLDCVILLVLFLIFVSWSIVEALHKREKDDEFLEKIEKNELNAKSSQDSLSKKDLYKALIKLSLGLIFLIVSSKILVWGATNIAKALNVSDLVIGLTIVAVGTSLPELASSIIATRKGEHDIALGNVIGSNIFNSLAVVGLAGVIQPFAVTKEILNRDMSCMLFLTLSLFVIGYGFKGRQGVINRFEGAFLLLVYVFYTYKLIG